MHVPQVAEGGGEGGGAAARATKAAALAAPALLTLRVTGHGGAKMTFFFAKATDCAPPERIVAPAALSTAQPAARGHAAPKRDGAASVAYADEAAPDKAAGEGAGEAISGSGGARRGGGASSSAEHRILYLPDDSAHAKVKADAGSRVLLSSLFTLLFALLSLSLRSPLSRRLLRPLGMAPRAARVWSQIRRRLEGGLEHSDGGTGVLLPLVSTGGSDGFSEARFAIVPEGEAKGEAASGGARATVRATVRLGAVLRKEALGVRLDVAAAFIWDEASEQLTATRLVLHVAVAET